MSRRLIGVLACLLLVVVSTIQLYGRVADRKIFFPLEIETSYFSLELLDDFADAARRGPGVKWSAREKLAGKLIIGEKVRRVRLLYPSALLYEPPGQARPVAQDVFRFQEVFRI